MQKADEEKRKKNGNKLPSNLPRGDEKEQGGQVCKSAKTGKYYCTNPSIGGGAGAPGISPAGMPPCKNGDSYAGFYHSHPNGRGLSQEDRDYSNNGWGTGWRQEQTKGKPVGATYRDNQGNLQTDVINLPPLPPK